jgi:hypothetical protein
MPRRKNPSPVNRPEPEPAPSDSSTEAVAARLPKNEADQYLRYLQLYKKATTSDRPTRVTLAELNEFALLSGKYARYEVDYIILGPLDPLNPWGRAFPICNTDYKVLTGKNATVCPRAKPQLGVKIVVDVVEGRKGLRERGLIGAGQTIHYTGPQADPDAICECDLAAVQAEADKPPPFPRLIIDLDSNSLSLDGTTHTGLNATGLRVIHALREAASGGNPVVSSKMLSQIVPGCRGGEKAVRRALLRLPDPVRALVKSRTGSGRWLELPSPK